MELINCLSSAIFRKSGLHHMLLGKTKIIIQNSCFLQLLFQSAMSDVKGFWSFGSSAPAVSPSSPLCTSSLLTGGVEWEVEKVFTLYKHWSATAKTSFCYQCNVITNRKHSTIQAHRKKLTLLQSLLSTLFSSQIQHVEPHAFLETKQTIKNK